MMKSLIVVLLLLVTTLTFAQPPDTLWTRTYGGSGSEYAGCIQQTTDGGYIVAGSIVPFETEDGFVYLLKTDSQGDTMWTRTYGEGVASCVQQTSDGGYILAGQTSSGYTDIYVVKTDSQGDTLWTRTYGGNSRDCAYSIQQTFDGGYILAGYTGSFGAGVYDFYLLKTNNQGDTLWTRTYGGSDWDAAASVQQTLDGGYVVAGHTESFGASVADFYLVKTDSQGDTLWTRTYGTINGDYAKSVQQTVDGGYIVAGTTYLLGMSDYDIYLVKTNSQGDTQWTRTYGGTDWDVIYSIQQTLDGEYVMAGFTRSVGAGYADFYVMKVNNQGDTLWTGTYGGIEEDWAASIQQTADGGYVVAGWTYSFGAGDADIYLVKLGAESSVPPISLSLPAHYSLHPNYPNPFNPFTRISYDLSTTSPVTLEVFDLLGRRVASLAKGTQPAGTYSILFNGSGFPSGLYFYRLHAGTFTQTQKMILLK
jgi:hypothetical protein